MGLMTLTCDASAKPVGLVPVRDAVARVAMGLVKGESGLVQVLVEDETRRFRSQRLDIPAPLVILEPSYVALNERETNRFSRRVMFARDGYTCQYCGFQASPGNLKALTVDHVKPAHMFESRHAATTFDNCVTACVACNQKKGGHLPMECHMYPANTPKRPHYVQLKFAGRLNAAQKSYVRDYFGEKIGETL